MSCDGDSAKVANGRVNRGSRDTDNGDVDVHCWEQLVDALRPSLYVSLDIVTVINKVCRVLKRYKEGIRQ